APWRTRARRGSRTAVGPSHRTPGKLGFPPASTKEGSTRFGRLNRRERDRRPAADGAHHARPAAEGVLPALRPGRGERRRDRPQARRAPRHEPERLAGADPRHQGARARRRPADARARRSPEPHVRDALRPRRHLPARERARRRLRPRRRGGGEYRRLRRARDPRGRAGARRRHPPRGDEAPGGGRPARRLPGLEPAAERAPGARGRGRPVEPGGGLGALPYLGRRDLDHPLEGHPRAARGGGGRLRERGGHPRDDRGEEPLARVGGEVLLVVVVAVALGFDFTNGFHDTANAVATSVSTRALSPRMAVLVASVANLAGAFVTTAVAKTVGKGIVDTGLATEQTVLAALLGAIAWNLLTWWFGLPSSSSHALIGGLVGAALVQSGSRGVQWHGIAHKVLLPGIVSPAAGFVAAFLLLLAI